MMRAPVELVQELVRRYNDQDLEGVVALFAGDAEIVSEVVHRGSAEVREHFEGLRSQFGKASLDEVTLHDAGGVVVMECLHRGAPPGGEPFALPMVMVFSVADGLIRRQRAYVDPGAFAALLAGAPAASR